MVLIQTHAKKHLPLLCAALLSLMIFLTLWHAISRWQADWAITHPKVAPSSPLLHNNTMALLAALPDKHVFGQNLSGEGVPVSNLALRVTGIVKIESEDGAGPSKAYISISGQPSKIYQAGDSLPYGAKIYDITSDAVILENDGQLEKLPLPREKLHFRERVMREEE